MKLYTEEDLRKAFIDGHKRGWSRAVYMHTGRTNKDADEFLNENELTPIEIPTDEEIKNESDSFYSLESYNLTFERGAKYVINKIQGGNK